MKELKKEVFENLTLTGYLDDKELTGKQSKLFDEFNGMHSKNHKPNG